MHNRPHRSSGANVTISLCCGELGGKNAAMRDPVMLFRPMSRAELDLVIESGMCAFPPRLEWQPIFYPVLNAEYATQIARDWNTKDGDVGYVTRFAVDGEFIAAYDVHQVGGEVHVEYWIPAEDLTEFNANLVGPIEVIAAYAGDPPALVDELLDEVLALVEDLAAGGPR